MAKTITIDFKAQADKLGKTKAALFLASIGLGIGSGFALSKGKTDLAKILGSASEVTFLGAWWVNDDQIRTLERGLARAEAVNHVLDVALTDEQRQDILSAMEEASKKINNNNK